MRGPLFEDQAQYNEEIKRKKGKANTNKTQENKNVADVVEQNWRLF